MPALERPLLAQPMIPEQAHPETIREDSQDGSVGRKQLR